MVHWTRQIKEVLASQEAVETSENAGPLEEIDFWRNRCTDLSGISEQLQKDGVIRVQQILEHSKSSYVTSFKKLSKLIQVSFVSQSKKKVIKEEIEKSWNWQISADIVKWEEPRNWSICSLFMI